HLLAVKGVADVNVFGGQVRQWQIQVEPERLARYGLAIQDVVQAARGATGVIAGGFVQGANQQIAITAEGQPGSVSELGRTMLAYRDGRGRTLPHLAKDVEGPPPATTPAPM